MRFLLLLCLPILACDDAEADDTPGPDAGWPPAGDTYVAGLEKAGETLRVRLMEALPAPPERGENRWVLEVVDAEETPLTGCTLVLSPDMPAHGHGTWKEAEVTEQEAGRYVAEPVFLYMPGLWEIPIEVNCGSAGDTVVYAFWIEG